MNRKFTSVIFGVTLAVGILASANTARAADDATVKLYQSKCASCHGPDGSGATVVGKALKLRDLHDPEIQKVSDDDIATVIAKGKDKMPPNEKTLKPDQIKALVGYTRELMKKK